MSVKSVTMRSTTRGWRTLTATSRPPRVARCTCAIEPDASARGSNRSKTASKGAPRACSTSRRLYANECSGARECSSPSSAQRRSGNMSGRTAAHWPHLMNAVPAEASARVTSQNHTRRRKGPSSAASGAVSSTGRKRSISASARMKRATGPGGASSTSAASSRAPSTERSGGGKPRATRLATTVPAPPASTMRRIWRGESSGGSPSRADHVPAGTRSNTNRSADEEAIVADEGAQILNSSVFECVRLHPKTPGSLE